MVLRACLTNDLRFISHRFFKKSSKKSFWWESTHVFFFEVRAAPLCLSQPIIIKHRSARRSYVNKWRTPLISTSIQSSSLCVDVSDYALLRKKAIWRFFRIFPPAVREFRILRPIRDLSPALAHLLVVASYQSLLPKLAANPSRPIAFALGRSTNPKAGPTAQPQPRTVVRNPSSSNCSA